MEHDRNGVQTDKSDKTDLSANATSFTEAVAKNLPCASNSKCGLILEKKAGKILSLWAYDMIDLKQINTFHLKLRVTLQIGTKYQKTINEKGFKVSTADQGKLL